MARAKVSAWNPRDTSKVPKINFLSWRCFWCICPSPLCSPLVLAGIPTRESVVWTKISRHEKGRLVQNRCCHICNGDLKAAARSENYSYSSLQNAGDKNGMRIERIVWNNSPTTKKHLHLITGYNCNSYTARARDPDPLISQFWNTYSQITFHLIWNRVTWIILQCLDIQKWDICIPN